MRLLSLSKTTSVRTFGKPAKERVADNRANMLNRAFVRRILA